jgi:predicted nucleic acid-binding protein
VLDANALVPPGLRDLLLSCASAGVFRPVWQSEIEAELRRHGARLLTGRGMDADEADAALEHVVTEMNRAFPDARLHPRSWRRLEESMTNQLKDRHVLAAAAAAKATHLVTYNTKDFSVESRPEGLVVQRPQAFLVAQLSSQPDRVLAAVRTMSRRHRRPPHTPEQLAERMAQSEHLPGFGTALLEALRA